MSRPVLGPIQPPVHWAPMALTLGTKQQVNQTVHSPAISAKVNEWTIISSPSLFLHGMYRESFLSTTSMIGNKPIFWRHGPCLLPELVLLMWKEQVFEMLVSRLQLMELIGQDQCK